MPMNIDFEKLHKQARDRELAAWVSVEKSYTSVASSARSTGLWLLAGILINMPYAVLVYAPQGEVAWLCAHVAISTVFGMGCGYCRFEALEADEKTQAAQGKISQLRSAYGLHVVRGSK